MDLRAIYQNAEHIIDKYGFYDGVDNNAVDDIWSPGGQLSWQTSAESLEILSASSDDSANGTGAQQVQVTGLDGNWGIQNETVTLDGTSAVSLTKTFLRVYRMRVVRRGTYTASNLGNITLRVASGGATRAQIRYDATFGGQGSTEMSHYSVPAGYNAYLTQFHIEVEASKPVDFYAFVRINNGKFTSPIGGQYFTPVKFRAVSGDVNDEIQIPQRFPEKSDFWARAKATGATTGIVEVRYQIALVRNGKAIA